MNKKLGLICIFFLIVCSVAHAADWIPDPHLERAIREKLDIPDGVPMLPEDMTELYDLVLKGYIESLKGLEHAINLNFLHLGRSEVSDLSPLAGLKNLWALKLFTNRISDLTPLSGLINLEILNLQNNQIEDISPLARLVNLKELNLEGNQITDFTPIYGLVGIETLRLGQIPNLGRSEVSDLSPLAGLKNLRVLKLFNYRISDLTPLSGLINLEILNLQNNQIEDISPLARLVNLKELNLEGNQITDFTPIYGLVGIETLRLGRIPIDSEVLQILNPIDAPSVCEIRRDPTRPRIENKEYPSFFGAWHNIINLPTLEWDEKLAYHDLYFCCPMFGLYWLSTPDGIIIAGNIENAKKQRDVYLARNPNMVFLVGIQHYTAEHDQYPEDSPYWLRNEAGNRSKSVGGHDFWLDYTHPDLIDITVQRALAVANCGVYDGIFLDQWSEGQRLEPYRSLEEDLNAREEILKRIRAEVGDNFLIMVNTNRQKIPRFAPYVNGAFMETGRDYDDGYTYAGLSYIESTLLWSEENLREPQINGLEGWGIESEPLDSPRNQKWMRLFTTMSLTHSDGYVQFVTGISHAIHTHQYEIWERHSDQHVRWDGHDHQHQHYWYDFYDAPLGRPVGGAETKGQLYEDHEGVFIREFTNGWAVYNRSGKEQEIEFSEAVSGWDSGVEHQRRHTLADLDGEIYLKAESGLETPPTADVNGDGVVNVLDLVIVANAFGEAAPDLNNDGIVNVLDLVIVANSF